MGRIIRREVVGVSCQLAQSRYVKRCSTQAQLTPLPVAAADLHMVELEQLAGEGWVFVLTPKLRAYCPTHADLAFSCICRTNPKSKPYCTMHSPVSVPVMFYDPEKQEVTQNDYPK